MRVLKTLGTLMFAMVLALFCIFEISAEGQAIESDEKLWSDFFESIPPAPLRL